MIEAKKQKKNKDKWACTPAPYRYQQENTVFEPIRYFKTKAECKDAYPCSLGPADGKCTAVM